MFDFDSGAAPVYAADLHCDAYNGAFYELGLRWHWDHAFYQVTSDMHEQAHLRAYLQTHQAHLLRAYDLDFLADAIQQAKARCLATMMVGGPSRRVVDWAEIQQPQVGA